MLEHKVEEQNLLKRVESIWIICTRRASIEISLEKGFNEEKDA